MHFNLLTFDRWMILLIFGLNLVEIMYVSKLNVIHDYW